VSSSLQLHENAVTEPCPTRLPSARLYLQDTPNWTEATWLYANVPQAINELLPYALPSGSDRCKIYQTCSKAGVMES
jgi:hypothetical protein